MNFLRHGMKEETKLALRFVVLLICGAVLMASCTASDPNPSASVSFSQARLEAHGSLKVDYDYTTPPGTVLHESDFINGTKTAESYGTGGSSPSGSSYHISVADTPSPPPAMLVTTGKSYFLKVNDRLPVYNFTNTSGKSYRGELSLERQ
jgi:hypothetical protein